MINHMKRAAALLPLLVLGCTHVMYQISDEDLEQTRQKIKDRMGRDFTVEIVDDLWVVASNADQVLNFKRSRRFVRAVATVGGGSPSFQTAVSVFGKKRVV